MQTIRLPNGQQVQFPAGMTDDEMARAIDESFPEFAAKATAPTAATPAEPSMWQRASGAVSSAIEGLGDAIRSVPMLSPPGAGSVMETAARNGELGPEAAPAGAGPMSRAGWAKIQNQEKEDPLDPRLAAIAPADPVARAQQIASERANAGKANYAGVMARAREDNNRAAAQAKREAERYSLANLAGNTAENVRNTAASALKIGPTALKGAADIVQLATADRFGKSTSQDMQEGMKFIDRVVGTDAFNEQIAGFQQMMADKNSAAGDMFEYLIDNPQALADAGITTIGSMILPAGVVKAGVMGARAAGLGAAGVTRVAGVATAGTVAAQNAADTFTSPELAGSSMEDRQKAAVVTAAITVLTGMATRGGAEGEIARRLAGDLRAGRTTVQAAKGYIKATMNEAAQEAGEELGGIAGQAVALGEAPDVNNSVKRMAFAATLGGLFGAGTHAVTGAGQLPDDGTSGADAARTDALDRWNNNGLTGSRTSGNPAPAAPGQRVEPTMQDIESAGTVDEAIEAAQALADAPAPQPSAALASTAEIDALEDAANAMPVFAEAGQAGAFDVADALPGAIVAAAESGAPSVAAAVDAAPGPTALTSALQAGKEMVPLAPADLPPGAQPAPALDAAGKETVDETADWYPFPPESRTMGVPRAQMPQIKAEHRGAMTQFLGARGITHEQVELDANDLAPTQREFSVSKVQKAIDFKGGSRSILVSSDGYVLDGHHQWLASAEKGEPVQAIRLNAPIKQLVRAVREFPSAGVDTSSAAPGPANAPEVVTVTTPALVSPARAADAKTTAIDQRNQRQAAAVIKAATVLEQRKRTGGQTARERVKAENPFLGFLASNGVAMYDRSDTGGQAGRAGGVMIPGYGPLYRRSGKRLDELANLALEAGFLSQQDVDDASDTGGTRKLADMIQRAVHGKEVIREAGQVEAAAPSADQQLLDEAQRLGLDTEGQSANQIYDAVSQAHQAEEQRRGSVGARSVDEQDMIDAYADEFSDIEAAVAADMLRDADIPLVGGTPSNNLTDEDIDEIFGIKQGGARTGGRKAQESATGAAAESAARAGATSGREEGETLTSYTAGEVIERQAAAAQRAKSIEAERARNDAQRKKQTDDRETRARVDASADNFQLGQDADAAVSGQDGLFDAKPAAAPAAQPSEDIDDDIDIPLAFLSTVTVKHRVYSDDGKTSEMLDVPADQALESVREDIDSLEAMIKCMGR